MFARISFIILLTFSLHWRSTRTAAQEDCVDKLGHCNLLESFCDHAQHKDYARSNCPETCKQCPADLDPDGLCSKIENGGCDHECEVEDKKIKKCTCYKGYKLGADGTSCEDIDECQHESCPKGEHCTNTPGGFSCDKVLCPKKEESPYMARAECCRNEPVDAACGITDAQTKRIVGGTDSYSGQWPWQVLVFINSATLCGGTLISPTWVVTAGHCFKNFDSTTTKFDLYFGVHNYKKLRQGRVQKRGMKRHILYPDWDQEHFEINDIALIELDRPVRYTKYIKPVCLPNGELPKVGTKCFAAGWGLTDEDSSTPSDVLQHVDLPIVKRPKCELNYKDEEIKVNGTFMMCAGYDEGGKDACRGDSGGPLVCQRCDSCGWYLAGVVSFGSGCARKGLYGVYADVNHYEEWISKHTSIPVTTEKRCTGPAFTAWTLWTECKNRCGTEGEQTRTRECRHKGAPSDKCSGESAQTQDCPLRKCPRFGGWDEWSQCSKSCGGGERSQIRRCLHGTIGDEGCPTDGASRTESCNSQACPKWGSWTNWDKCSKTCGSGEQERTRQCIGGEPSQKGCDGDAKETRECNTDRCPGWTDWGSWAKCSVTCGGGVQESTRSCIGKGKCTGESTRSRACNTQLCPVFGKWGKWEKCDVTCAGGKQFRTRPCENGKIGDIGCGKGKETESQNCNTQSCPEFSTWSWGDCSVTCGGGEQEAVRKCKNGEVGQKGCEGSTSKKRPCATDECIGEFGAWRKWSTCSKTCGDGTQTRDRPCEGGTKCIGKKEEEKSCKIKNCPVFDDWMEWGDCSKTCGGGTHSRSRDCLYSDNPKDCKGEPQETESCNDEICPGKWTPWTDWSKCDVTCDEGTMTRSRQCEGGRVGNPGCDDGAAGEAESCEMEPCPSSWGKWKQWGTCSKPCGRGQETRTRPCEGGKPGKGGCIPASDGTEHRDCNEVICAECENVDDNYCDTYFNDAESCEHPFGERYCLAKCKFCPELHEHWNQWSPCSSTCGTGTRERTRDCKNTGKGGCEGESTETESCEASCKGFSPWDEWTRCTVTCNGGTRTRQRTCPFDTCEPDKSGSSALTEEGTCNENACPGEWENWEVWGKCSVTCGNNGEQERTRNCKGGKPGGPGCPGSDKQTRRCRNLLACPGKWTQWSDWSDCSVTCGEGQREKERKCENGIIGQTGCTGEAKRTESCDAGDCVAKWGDWGDWGECDADCVRTRKRKCNGGRAGDPGCKGPNSDSEDCDEEDCREPVLSSCGNLDDFSIICGGYTLADCRGSAILLQQCAKRCCEENEAGPCEDNPQYGASTCTYTSFCNNSQYKAFFDFHCRKSCGICV